MSDSINQSDPDDSEQIEEKKEDDFLVVGLGASAGGIKAFKEFFTHVKPDSGMAYVVILHMSPEHESKLAEILQGSSRIPVTQVSEPVKIEPDHVYVIPPNKSLSMMEGSLTLSDIRRIEERRAPVDIFFRTLAMAKKSRAVCVILSGTGANGSMGLKRIKEFGGLALVQNPKEADYDDMPRNSIATGFADQVLSVADMPDKIAAYRQHISSVQIRVEPLDHVEKDDEALRDIFTQIRWRTGHDFSDYKRATVLRRIKRRISVHGLPDIVSYARLLRERPEEARALLKDMLISVTHFFRDSEAFEALERKIIPRLFEGRKADGGVRVWVPGCATGEEAYSITILLAEYASNLDDAITVQVFATDIDEDAIMVARNGFYTKTEVADVSPERLRRFFVKEATGYRVRKDLREKVLFAVHNIINDPPFSRLDLISCRNMLIYLNRIAQDRVMGVLHFALRPGGYLFLGTSESTDGPSGLFVAVDKDHHIYQSHADTARASLNLSGFSPTIPVRHKQEEPLSDIRKLEHFTYSDLHHRLLESYAPPSVVVNEEYEVVHLSERAGQYLQIKGGEPSYNLLKIARPELRAELRAALYQAMQNRTNVEVHDVRMRVEDRMKSINLHVRPILNEYAVARGFILVIFEEAGESAEDEARPAAEIISDIEPATRHLEEELTRVKSQLRMTVDQYEIQTEELKASNEELQAMNEELRSTAEELETSREELQSLNEELTTVNQELKVKIEELSHANNDLRNLMASTEIGTIFLDRSMRVKLFTPRACDIFNLIESDMGRPLLDITSKLEHKGLQADIEHVLNKLQALEREVKTQEGRWYLMRVSPYRTAEYRIDGVILTFLDITRRKEAEERVRSSEERLRLLIESAKDYAIFSLTDDNRIETWSAGAERLFGYRESEIIGQSGEILFTPQDREQGLPEERIRRAREEGGVEDELWLLRKDGTRFYSGVGTWPFQGSHLSGFVKIARDLTEQKNAQEELRRARDELEMRGRERTTELENANQSLQAEVLERRAAEERVRGLMRQLVTAQEDERGRIARDLHDQLGQKLTALQLTLEFLYERCRELPDMAEEFDKARLMIKNLDAEVDFLSWELRPAALDDLGLVATLRNYLQEWSKQFDIAVEFQTSRLEEDRLLPEIETTLYRIAQEALNNIFKHAEATKVGVILKRRDGEVALIIEDDGKGFDSNGQALDAALTSIGLTGMRERASLLGGTLEIESSPGKGTTIFVRIPCSLAEKGEPEE